MKEETYETYVSPRGRLLPRYITKYTTLDVLTSLQSGSVKIGNLEEYRRNEDVKVLMSDKDEGVRRLSVLTNKKSFAIKELNIGLDHIKNIWGVGMGSNEALTYEVEMDAHVYCAQVGNYSATAHRQFVEGYGTYPGNEGYLGYVVYETDLFCKALVQAFIPKIAPEFCEGIQIELIRYSDSYRNIQYEIGAEEASIFVPDFIERDIVFSKPTFFTVENEIRIWLLPYASALAANLFILKSDAIRASVVASGKL